MIACHPLPITSCEIEDRDTISQRLSHLYFITSLQGIPVMHTRPSTTSTRFDPLIWKSIPTRWKETPTYQGKALLSLGESWRANVTPRTQPGIFVLATIHGPALTHNPVYSQQAAE